MCRSSCFGRAVSVVVVVASQYEASLESHTYIKKKKWRGWGAWGGEVEEDKLGRI